MGAMQGYREEEGCIPGQGWLTQSMKGPAMWMALSRWALLLGLLVGGCAAGPSAAGRAPRTAGDPCTARGGVMVGETCYPGAQDPSDAWSERTLQEMHRGFEERQPGGGRFR
jgi:hypothetical protein